jgi:hypothetical protein
MSTAVAVGATMRCIASIVDSAISTSGTSALGAATTTVLPPDRNEIGASEVSHLNLFLFAVTMNAGWRNVERMRANDGSRVGKSPLAVDLHFMMSAYGHVEYDAEILLGVGMQSMYEQSFLDRGQIRSLFGSAASDEEKIMAQSLLDQQIEQIKISEHDLSADELYKLWSAFGSKCRPSAAYVATVVLIDSRAQAYSAPPVLTRNVGVVAMDRVQIDEVTPAIFVMTGGPVSMTLSGSALNQPGNVALIGEDLEVALRSTSPAKAILTVPAGVVPGVNLLQVVRAYAIGVTPPEKRIGSSNPIAFIVQPSITAITKVLLHLKAGLKIDITPSCNDEQKATLLLEDGPLHFTIDALPEDNALSNVTFDISDVPAGTYVVRIRIAGTESVPAFDPVLGFTGPTVMLP